MQAKRSLARALFQSIRSNHRFHSQYYRSFSTGIVPSSPKGVAAQIFRAGSHKYGSFYEIASLFRIAGQKLSTSAPAFAHAVQGSGNVLQVPLVAGGDAARKKVAIWLFSCSGMVFSMVVLGGMTRLTRSGLSMTDWKFTGSLPPLSVEEWKFEFEKYKQSPEYQRVNKGMSLEDFKFIYWMEYAHRMWGRAIGIVFAVPFGYFLAKGYITKRLSFYLSGLLAMGAGQGLVGWWMVKSGLEEPVSEYAQPRVSPYRLAAHLTSAFVLYSGLFWTALSVAFPQPQGNLSDLARFSTRKVRRMVLPLTGLVGITAISGAFVAGNDAGRAFNTFPMMGDHWIPEGIFELQPFIRNFFENTALVQLNHRLLAITTLTSIASVWLTARHLHLEPRVLKLLTGTLHMSVLQVALGITTLLTYVPVSLGVAHQAGALTLLSMVIALLHSLRRQPLTILKTCQAVVR